MKRTAGPSPLSRYESSCPFNIAVHSRMSTITAPIRCVRDPSQDSVTPRPGAGITASARPLVTLAAASDLPLAGSGDQHVPSRVDAARHRVCALAAADSRCPVSDFGTGRNDARRRECHRGFTA